LAEKGFMVPPREKFAGTQPGKPFSTELAKKFSDFEPFSKPGNEF
jgi:hypothetical protein